eukprot:CAMPEP_0115858418 /NCGR_PEP_ID=MMETSP0287-20121206/16087_1 /TAXON_ID=412157 /ORGANISM="Chrysochromulina rotalis, Strain UIO044" /LENGTH=56 /DNA_ID=CAMNT_0003312681 /DNA_START=272 /DNA_END=442 /DNA_ORIENTATION=+
MKRHREIQAFSRPLDNDAQDAATNERIEKEGGNRYPSTGVGQADGAVREEKFETDA